MINNLKKVKMARDCSNRHVLEILGIDRDEYNELLLKIITHFNLEPKENKITGYDEEFQDYILDKYVISLEYDIWVGFTIVAKNESSLILLNRIYIWLIKENGFKE